MPRNKTIKNKAKVKAKVTNSNKSNKSNNLKHLKQINAKYDEIIENMKCMIEDSLKNKNFKIKYKLEGGDYVLYIRGPFYYKNYRDGLRKCKYHYLRLEITHYALSDYWKRYLSHFKKVYLVNFNYRFKARSETFYKIYGKESLNDIYPDKFIFVYDKLK